MFSMISWNILISETPCIVYNLRYYTFCCIVYILGDALFNLPCFLTVNHWSQNGAPTFLYSFEHLGKRQKGDAFLLGSPIFGNNTIQKEEGGA